MKIYANTSNSYPWSKFVGKDLWVSFDFAGERPYLKINRIYTDERGQCRVDFDYIGSAWVEHLGSESPEQFAKHIYNKPSELLWFFNDYFTMAEPADVYTTEELQELATSGYERYMSED
jgi:hypothetical protein